jgi:hypothetical protein
VPARNQIVNQMYGRLTDLWLIETAALAERNLCAEPELLKRCILRSRVGSADANSRHGCYSTDRAQGGC